MLMLTGLQNELKEEVVQLGRHEDVLIQYVQYNFVRVRVIFLRHTGSSSPIATSLEIQDIEMNKQVKMIHRLHH